MNLDFNYTQILLLALVVFFLSYFFRSVFSGMKGDVKKPYVSKDNPNAQHLYDEKEKNQNPMTMDEKIELSWLFLYEITDIVLNKFSAADRESVTAIGRDMLKSSAGYEHVIEYGIKKTKKVSRLSTEYEVDQVKSL